VQLGAFLAVTHNASFFTNCQDTLAYPGGVNDGWGSKGFL